MNATLDELLDGPQGFRPGGEQAPAVPVEPTPIAAQWGSSDGDSPIYDALVAEFVHRSLTWRARLWNDVREVFGL